MVEGGGDTELSCGVDSGGEASGASDGGGHSGVYGGGRQGAKVVVGIGSRPRWGVVVDIGWKFGLNPRGFEFQKPIS